MKITYNITRYLRALQALQLCLVLLLPLVFVSCADESEAQPEHDVAFCVRAVWQDGLTGGKTTRSLSATDILADGTSDINIDFADYPTTINVLCKKGETEVLPLTLTKGSALCSEHTGYWSYAPSFLFRDQLIRREDYKFYATATIDEDDELEGTADKNDIYGTHLLLTLHHTKALLRFAFKVSEKYSKVRHIVVKGVRINGNNCTTVPKVINTTALQAVSYMYITPSAVDADITSTPMQIECTYDIYEKDAIFASNAITDDEIASNAAHLTREGVIAQNRFTLNNIAFSSSAAEDHKIKAGYYYDLKVTLNPDYLYVLSEHDNKHITIN